VRMRVHGEMFIHGLEIDNDEAIFKWCVRLVPSAGGRG